MFLDTQQEIQILVNQYKQTVDKVIDSQNLV